MTSFIIKAHVDRKIHSSWTQDPTCPFCKIVSNEAPSSRVYEDDKVVAFLDILPLRPGHALVVPKVHCPRVSDLPAEFAAAVGEAVSKVAKAMTEALDNTALNIVCNQEYAQAVPHVHYHIIPAPDFSKPASREPSHPSPTTPFTERQMHRMEFESREFLEDEDAIVLAEKIRSHL